MAGGRPELAEELTCHVERAREEPKSERERVNRVRDGSFGQWQIFPDRAGAPLWPFPHQLSYLRMISSGIGHRARPDDCPRFYHHTARWAPCCEISGSQLSEIHAGIGSIWASSLIPAASSFSTPAYARPDLMVVWSFSQVASTQQRRVLGDVIGGMWQPAGLELKSRVPATEIVRAAPAPLDSKVP